MDLKGKTCRAVDAEFFIFHSNVNFEKVAEQVGVGKVQNFAAIRKKFKTLHNNERKFIIQEHRKFKIIAHFAADETFTCTLILLQP